MTDGEDKVGADGRQNGRGREGLEAILQPGVTANEAFNRLLVWRVENYLRDLEGVRGLPLYEMITQAAERPLLDWAMKQCNGNQRAAATLLGINRNTLRKKLMTHGFSTSGL